MFVGILLTLFAQCPGFLQGFNIRVDTLFPCGGGFRVHYYITLFKEQDEEDLEVYSLCCFLVEYLKSGVSICN